MGDRFYTQQQGKEAKYFGHGPSPFKSSKTKQPKRLKADIVKEIETELCNESFPSMGKMTKPDLESLLSSILDIKESNNGN